MRRAYRRTRKIGAQHRKHVHCDDLNDEVSNNNCYDATAKSPRDAAISPKVSVNPRETP